VLVRAQSFSMILFYNKVIHVRVCVYMFWTRSLPLFSSTRCVRMSVFVYVCVCMCICLCLCLCLRVHAVFHDSVLHSGVCDCVRACVRACMRACVRACVCACACAGVSLCACFCVDMFVRMFVCA